MESHKDKSMGAASEQLDALLHAAVDAIIVIDDKARIQRFNQAAEKMFGYAESDVLGQNVNILMLTPYREEHDEYIQHYHQTHKPNIIGIAVWSNCTPTHSSSPSTCVFCKNQPVSPWLPGVMSVT